MTASGESRKETTGMKLEVMSAKTKTRIGFWNVRTRPKTTWRRTVEKGLRELNYSWSTIEKLAKDRQCWKDFVAALCAT